jgi:hypothetical protein|tara:strand:- start:2718 stop:3851 length:1134 start_codon:yes stop_codon:yes gene_type:complete
MSGALIQLVSKGVQDAYIISEEGHSFFRTKFTRHTNFSQAPKFIKNITLTDTSITIPVLGDLINGIWLEAGSKNANIASNLFYNSTIDLFIGGQKIDSQDYDYFSDIWTNYLADTYTKSQELNNKTSTSNHIFLPLHFFFCDHKAFLPLIALQHHQVEIKITFDETNVAGLSAAEKTAKVYGNYIYLDKEERETFTTRNLDFIITQVQGFKTELLTVANNAVDVGGHNKIDLSHFNHPVKSIFWGFGASSEDFANDRFTFLEADLQINGTHLFEKMSPVYFHTVQNYYKSSFGHSDYIPETDVLFNTRYFAYHFCLNASEYNPSGSCNFSRIDNAVLSLNGVEKGNLRAAGQEIFVYVVNYNVLRIRNGLAGILFGN